MGGKRGKKKHRHRRRGRRPAAEQRALDDRALGGLTVRDLAAEGILRPTTGRTAAVRGKPHVRELMDQIGALRARLEQRRGMRDEWHDADRLAAALAGQLTNREQRRIRDFFASEPEAAGDVERLADVAALLRRAVDDE